MEETPSHRDLGQMEQDEQRAEKTWDIWPTENSSAWEFTWSLRAGLLPGTPGSLEYAKVERVLALVQQMGYRSACFGERLHTGVTSS